MKEAGSSEHLEVLWTQESRLWGLLGEDSFEGSSIQSKRISS